MVATEAVLVQRTYFTPVLVAYVGGLMMAFAANSITHLGQVRGLACAWRLYAACAVTCLRSLDPASFDLMNGLHHCSHNQCYHHHGLGDQPSHSCASRVSISDFDLIQACS